MPCGRQVADAPQQQETPVEQHFACLLTHAHLLPHPIHPPTPADGEYACPVTGKVFTEHTHIVAIKPSGNVYAWDSLDQLCIKPKNWKDLLTDEPFSRKDIITLQDPLNMTAKLITDFDHVKKVGGWGLPNWEGLGSSGAAQQSMWGTGAALMALRV
jgi:hypothetical protein